MDNNNQKQIMTEEQLIQALIPKYVENLQLPSPELLT